MGSGDLQTCCLLLDLRMLNVPRVSIVVPFLVNQFYGQDLVIEILVPKKGTTMETIGSI